MWMWPGRELRGVGNPRSGSQPSVPSSYSCVSLPWQQQVQLAVCCLDAYAACHMRARESGGVRWGPLGVAWLISTPIHPGKPPGCNHRLSCPGDLPGWLLTHPGWGSPAGASLCGSGSPSQILLPTRIGVPGVSTIALKHKSLGHHLVSCC